MKLEEQNITLSQKYIILLYKFENCIYLYSKFQHYNYNYNSNLPGMSTIYTLINNYYNICITVLCNIINTFIQNINTFIQNINTFIQNINTFIQNINTLIKKDLVKNEMKT